MDEQHHRIDLQSRLIAKRMFRVILLIPFFFVLSLENHNDRREGALTTIRRFIERFSLPWRFYSSFFNNDTDVFLSFNSNAMTMSLLAPQCSHNFFFLLNKEKKCLKMEYSKLIHPLFFFFFFFFF